MNEMQLFATLANGYEVRLDRIEHGADGEQVAVTMHNGQMVKDCFWRDPGATSISTNEMKVRKLIRFVHEQNRPSYQRFMLMLKPYLPKFIVEMNGYTMMAIYAVAFVVVAATYYWYGLLAFLVSPVVLLALWMTTLSFDEMEGDESGDYNTLEVAAASMLGILQTGDQRLL